MRAHDDAVRDLVREHSLLLETLARAEERWPRYHDVQVPGWPLPGTFLGHLPYATRLFLKDARLLASGRGHLLEYTDEAAREHSLARSRPRNWAELHAGLARAHASVLSFVARCPEDAWLIAADHPRVGPGVRARGMIKLLARHAREHRQDLESLLQGG